MVVVFVPDSMGKTSNICTFGWTRIVTFGYCNRVRRHKFTAQRAVCSSAAAIERVAAVSARQLTTAKSSVASYAVTDEPICGHWPWLLSHGRLAGRTD